MYNRNMAKTDVQAILKKLHQKYKNPKTELENWTNTMQFAACVILSAQATDKGVNKITLKLFEKYHDIDDFANANLEDMQQLVSSINYYKTKAQRIIDAAKFVRDEFYGKFPKSIDELVKIPGIGRKSANVILQETMNETHGVVVDTHITRVSRRLGITTYDNQKDAVKIENELKAALPKKEWGFYSGAVVLHGRYVCKAKKPDCANCVLKDLCPSAFQV